MTVTIAIANIGASPLLDRLSSLDLNKTWALLWQGLSRSRQDPKYVRYVGSPEQIVCYFHAAVSKRAFGRLEIAEELGMDPNHCDSIMGIIGKIIATELGIEEIAANHMTALRTERNCSYVGPGTMEVWLQDASLDAQEGGGVFMVRPYLFH